MRKFLMVLGALSFATVFSNTVIASTDTEAEALIKACEQQTQGAPDRYAAITKCLDEKLQYDTSPGGE
jgi:hypothetical protein